MKRLRLVLILSSLALILFGQAVPCPAQTPPVAQKHNSQAHRTKAITLGSQGHWIKAITEFQAAYQLDKTSDPGNAGRDLYDIGICEYSLRRYGATIHDYQQALVLSRQVKDTQGQANILNNLGLVYQNLDQFRDALVCFQQALVIDQQIHDKRSQALNLNNLGLTYHDLNQEDTAIADFQQALVIDQQAGDKDGEAKVLNNLGLAYNSLSQYDKAISDHQQALSLFQEMQDKVGEASSANDLGTVYETINEYPKAIQYHQQALIIDRQIKDKEGEAANLGNLGNAYEGQHQYHTAIQYHQQSLMIDRQINNIDGEAANTENLGVIYFDLGQYTQAIYSFQQALRLHQQIHDTEAEVGNLNDLGGVYNTIHQEGKALLYFQKALPIAHQIKNREGEAVILSNLMKLWQQRSTPRLAIFYGKQSINVYQSIRQDIHSLAKEAQKDYLKDKEPTYRLLAELLIAQGRLPEAEQVLNLLKNQEFFDFVQRDAANAPEAGQASLTPVEDTWQARYQMIADKVTAIGQTKQDLLTKQQQADQGQITLTPTQKADLQKNLTQADSDLTVANQAFQDFLTQLTTESQNAPKTDQDKVQTVTDAAAFEDTLSQLGPGTVALYTIVEPQKVRILVVTSQTQVAREYPIKDTELRAKVLAFRQVLQDPTRDPRPLAHELYTILMGPIERDLQGAQATTLMWSLDDVLRYVPMAALYDGKQYLVEHYKNEVFTPASESRLTETPKAEWNGLGLGVSLAHDNFPALTGVPQELDDVIHDPTVTASQTGALPGTILLDTAFTQQAMTQALEERKYPLVHIASHFDFQPGDETDSFLLLGDGGHLTLADIKTLPQVFQGVDLLTLSACDTADGSTGADGREVEGFAVLAQRLGAKAVIASLWPVADASTPLLMETFYRQHAAVPGQPKAEALRQAQLALLHGTVSAPATGTQRAQIVPGKSDKSVVDAPVFTPDPKVPFAHPYYWAPFILIGNWK